MTTTTRPLSPSLLPCAAFIQITCFDAATNQTIVLGGLGHVTADENDKTWSLLQKFEGQSSFSAEKLDASRKRVDSIQVSAQSCEDMLRRPIEVLLTCGRSRAVARAGRVTRCLARPCESLAA
jgi:hypothetical protein